MWSNGSSGNIPNGIPRMGPTNLARDVASALVLALLYFLAALLRYLCQSKSISMEYVNIMVGGIWPSKKLVKQKILY